MSQRDAVDEAISCGALEELPRDAMTTPTPCDHDGKYRLFGLPKETNGCLACAYEKAIRDLAAANAENAVLRDAINDALPWMIKLGDYIGNGTQADPMGRCNAILKMRIAVEKRND